VCIKHARRTSHVDNMSWPFGRAGTPVPLSDCCFPLVRALARLVPSSWVRLNVQVVTRTVSSPRNIAYTTRLVMWNHAPYARLKVILTNIYQPFVFLETLLPSPTKSAYQKLLICIIGYELVLNVVVLELTTSC